MTSFEFEFVCGTKDSEKYEIPKNISALNGQKVFIEGYMLPIIMAGPTIKDFMLLASQMECCFGQAPATNGWVKAYRRDNEEIKTVRDVPIQVFEILLVGEREDEFGGNSLYQMTVDKVVPSEGVGVIGSFINMIFGIE